ncbi:MAG: Uma2 family endonuclease [Anaerolineales bacterium]|nr:Uma2 family endonuclease [Anaerolineales bacterium]
MSTAAYLAAERAAETKHEYWNGAIYAMTGASARHNIIVSNVIFSLKLQLRGRACTVYPSDLRVKVAATGLYTYPDVTVVCGKSVFDDRQQDTLLNPTLIVEVLSRTTAAYDRGAKFAHYRTLESLRDYVLISQDIPLVEHFARQPDDKWLLGVYDQLESVITLDGIPATLPLSELYDQLDWPVDDASPLRIMREEADLYSTVDQP